MLTRAACRAVDELAVSRFGLPTIVLMENAARGLAGVAVEMTKRAPGRPVVIVCGPGNNGGDGLAAARFLVNAGRKVRVVTLTREPATADARVHRVVVEAMGVPVACVEQDAGAVRKALARGPGLIVEGLFGTGLTRPLEGPAAGAVAAIAAARGRGWKVLAADLPAGLDADTGEPVGDGPCVEADATATFAAMKPGLLKASARRYAGRVTVVDIGVPVSLIRELASRR